MMSSSCTSFRLWLYFGSPIPSKGTRLEGVDDSYTYWLGSAGVVVRNIEEIFKAAASDVSCLDDDDRRLAAAMSG